MAFTLDSFQKMVKKMEKVLFFITTEESIKDPLKETWNKERAINVFQMALILMGISAMDLKKEKALSVGPTDKLMTVSGQRERKMEAECGKVQKGIRILVSGTMEK